MVTTARPVETRDQAFRRLLDVARESGVKLGRDSHGEFWATSVSEPGRLYRVEPDSCGCRGFQAARRCRHVAALRSYLGYFDDPDPAPVAVSVPEPCRGCDGRGYWIKAKQIGRGQFVRDDVTCPHCRGTGHQVAA
jgi:hypothetical protein